MQAGFALGDERQARSTIFCIRDKASLHRCFAHQSLLATLPSVWVAEDIFRCGFQVLPQNGSGYLRFLDVFLRTLVQVLEEVSEDLNGCLSFG